MKNKKKERPKVLYVGLETDWTLAEACEHELDDTVPYVRKDHVDETLRETQEIYFAKGRREAIAEVITFIRARRTDVSCIIADEIEEKFINEKENHN